MKFPAAIFPVVLGCWACASTSSLPHGDEMLVRYQQVDKGKGEVALELVLVKESFAGYSGAQSEAGVETSTKKVPADLFESLLDRIEAQGFADMAQPLARGVRPFYSDSSRGLLVESGGSRWFWPEPPEGSGEYWDFQEMVQTFCDCFNSVFSPVILENEGGVELFRRQQDRIQRDNERKLRFQGLQE